MIWKLNSCPFGKQFVPHGMKCTNLWEYISYTLMKKQCSKLKKLNFMLLSGRDMWNKMFLFSFPIIFTVFVLVCP